MVGMMNLEGGGAVPASADFRAIIVWDLCLTGYIKTLAVTQVIITSRAKIEGEL